MPGRKEEQTESSWNLLGEDAGEMFHRSCHTWSAKISPENPVPDTAEEWLTIRDARRAWLRQAMGLREEEPCPLNPEITGVDDRGDYVLEKTLLRSRPNLVLTTHLYIPKKAPKPAPAVLSVHGHWGNGKLNEVVQSRNIGMTKLGFVVLCVDAIGSGERAYQGEMYHGRQLGAQAFPAGLTLAGLQVWDNMRGLDYLCSRPEVDATRIACTGASGGCNQTLYLAALDERVAAAAPVCCIGSLEGYLNGAHCVCEMIPGIKQLGEMVDVLSLLAPRPLILINGIHDGGAGFQVDDMRAQFPKLKRVYELLGAGDKVAKSAIDLGHGYFPQMRE
ncbi:MAG: acetylxylan esterase, partial [Armatimonadetes bacterium]|nr:acetylxylan esterase [Armatimonadota bacterium]